MALNAYSTNQTTDNAQINKVLNNKLIDSLRDFNETDKITFLDGLFSSNNQFVAIFKCNRMRLYTLINSNIDNDYINNDRTDFNNLNSIIKTLMHCATS